MKPFYLAIKGEVIKRIIGPHRRLARGYRNRGNYRLRMLLAASGLIP